MQAATVVSPQSIQEVLINERITDIGGGNVQDEVEVSLAQITLKWMVEQAIQSQCGILFDLEALARIDLTTPVTSTDPVTKVIVEQTQLTVNGDSPPIVTLESRVDVTKDAKADDAHVTSTVPDLRKQVVTPAPTSGNKTELADAIAPLYDELQINKLWWILEIIPFPFVWQDDNGVWHKKWR